MLDTTSSILLQKMYQTTHSLIEFVRQPNVITENMSDNAFSYRKCVG